MFRDQNATAKLNSERARRGIKRVANPVCPYDATKDDNLRALDVDDVQSCEPLCSLAKAQNAANPKAWLSIPSPILFRLEDRIMDIFYAEWVSRPCTKLKNPGYLDLLPEMKAKAAPVSALNLAVEASTLPNAGNSMTCYGNLEQMALSRCGATLAFVRKAIMHHTLVADDATFMAIMTIDMFEVNTLRTEHSGTLED